MRNVCLTFDNGPDPDITPGVLDMLSKHGIKASFFVLGRKIAQPECLAICQRAADEGHWIGNHTYTHETPLGLLSGPDVVDKEVASTQRLMGALAHPNKLFRPFGGGGAIGPHLLNTDVLRHLQEERFTCVLWNVIPRDWEDGETWPERALDLMQGQTDSLVVLHDIAGPQMSQLERFIKLVIDNGGEFQQAFPLDCVPLHLGHAHASMAPYTTS